MTRHIIVWQGDSPELYCSHLGDDRWWVINGAWTCRIDEQTLDLWTDEGIDIPIEVTRITEAEPDGDYNTVMYEARANA